MAGHRASKTRVNALASPQVGFTQLVALIYPQLGLAGVALPATSLMLHGFEDVDARATSAFTRAFDAPCAGITTQPDLSPL